MEHDISINKKRKASDELYELDSLQPKSLSHEKKTTLPNLNTSIIAITCHGELAYDGEEIDEVVVPQGIEIIKLSLAYKGVITCADKIDTYEYIRYIINSKNELLSDDKNIVDQAISNISSNIRKRIKLIYNVNAPKFKRSAHDEREYLIRYNQGLKVNYLYPGDKIAKKIYSRNKLEKDGLDFSIPIISARLFPTIIDENKHINFHDLMNMIGIPVNKYIANHEKDQDEDEDGESKEVDDDTDVLDTYTIFNYFKNIGKSKLIIFDFSCSHINAESDRNFRFARRSMRNLPTGGKRKKYKYTKSKNNKYKKSKNNKYKNTKNTKYKTKKYKK